MPYLTDRIGPRGPVIDVVVGVSQTRRRLLQKHGLPVPAVGYVRALIDTGADISGFAPRVFGGLELPPVGKFKILTPSTLPDRPHECDLYDVALSLVAGGRSHLMPESRVMAADCWLPGEGIEGLIGRDILDQCFFQYMGPDRIFTLAF
jgi:hypothetical protein